jgi:cell division protein FtsQ
VPPTSSRLTVRKHKNRRRPESAWSRLPKPALIVDACGRALRRSLRGAALIGAVAAVGGGVWASYRWIASSPRFAITEITVHGAHHVDADQLRAALPIHVGDNVFVDLAAVGRAVRSNPWIAGAEVRRVLPHAIAIDVREHVAAAVVALGDADERYFADAAGHPFKRVTEAELGDAADARALPLITGIARTAFTADPEATAHTVRDAIAAAADWAAAQRPAIGEIHVDGHGAVTLHAREPAVAIQLGALGGPLEARIHTFDTAWAGLSDPERARARAIHLDGRSDHVTVAFAKD